MSATSMSATSATQAIANGRQHAIMAVVSMCIVNVMVSGLCWNCLTLYADPIISDWGITRTSFMFIITMLSGFNTFVSLFLYGRIEQALGLRRMLVLGGTLLAGAHVIWALSNSVVLLYVGGALAGLGISMMSDNTFNVACTYWFKKNRGTMIGIVGTLGTVSGSAFALAVAAWIIAVGWRGGFWITAVIVIICTLVGVFLYKGKPEDLGEFPYGADQISDEDSAAEEETGITYKEMLRTPQCWLYVVIWLFVGIAGFAVRGSLPLLAADFGFGDMQGALLSTLLIACAVFMPIGGYLCDRLGSRSMVFIGMTAVVIACLILRMESVSLPLLYLCAVLLGFGWDVNIVPIAPCIIENFGHREIAKKSGLYVGMQAGGVAIGPTILNAFYDLGGHTYSLGLLVMAAMAIATIVLYMIGEHLTKRAE